jgi:hypothetical protein
MPHDALWLVDFARRLSDTNNVDRDLSVRGGALMALLNALQAAAPASAEPFSNSASVPLHSCPESDVKREPTRSRVLPPLRATWERACRAWRWLEDSWIGDLIGAICIFLIPVAGLFLGMVFE